MSVTSNKDISEFLNDVETNYIADLFLSCCGFDRTSKDHRLVRNAVLIFPHCDGEHSMLTRLSEVTEIPSDEIARRLTDAVSTVDVVRSFNDSFNGNSEFIDQRKNVTMPELKSTASILSFLGATLAYIIKTNYPSY